MTQQGVQRWILFALCGAIGLACAGCPTTEPPPQKDPIPEKKHPELTANEILLQTELAYATQVRYADNAKLYLSYRLQDRYIQEQQPWAIRWQRDVGFSLSQFNAEITHDGKRLSCFVFDNDTGNLDLQQLLVAEPMASSLRRVLRDSIARHYVGGHAELPIVSAEVDPSTPLVSPVWGWLTQEFRWPLLVAPDSSRRLADGLVDGRVCYHLQVQRGEQISELWIDQESKLVRQMTIPEQILDARVRQSPDITEIQFFARMHEATFDPPVTADAFEIRVPADAKPLQQFLAIPQPFPCDAVGKSVQPVLLQSPAGLPIDTKAWGNRVSVLIWVADDTRFQSIELSKDFQQWVKSSQLRYGLVYSDEHLAVMATPQADVPALISQWNARQPTPADCWYDPQSQWTDMIGLKNLPAAIVINQQGVIEYALSLNDTHWSDKLDGAIRRILAGESIAAEMVSDYQNYLTRYREKLERVRSSEFSDQGDSPTGASSAIRLRERFRLKNLARPGNLYVSPQPSGTWYALDGWRTIVELDRQGQVLKTIQPQLPAGAAIDSLRWNHQVSPSDSLGSIAAFSTLGKAIYLFDSNWQPLAKVDIPESAQGVLDCGFVTQNSKSSLWANLVGQGLCEYLEEQGQWQVRIPQTIEAFAASDGEILAGGQGQLHRFDSATQQATKLVEHGLQNQHWNSMKPFDASRSDTRWLLSRIEPSGHWKMQVMQQGQWIGTAVNCGSQMFDEPVDFLQTTSGPAVGSRAIAGLNRQGTMFLWNANGDYLGQVWIGQSVTGFALAEWDGQPVVIVSSENQVIVSDLEIK